MSSPADPTTSCDCLQIPPMNRTNPPPSRCSAIGGTFRYTCVVGYLRQAGTSNLIKCVRQDGVAKWSAPTLQCIREYFSYSSKKKKELQYSTPTGMRMLSFSRLSDKHVNPVHTWVTGLLLRGLRLQQPRLWIWQAQQTSCQLHIYRFVYKGTALLTFEETDQIQIRSEGEKAVTINATRQLVSSAGRRWSWWELSYLTYKTMLDMEYFTRMKNLNEKNGWIEILSVWDALRL